jgi:hypothetical protein
MAGLGGINHGLLVVFSAGCCGVVNPSSVWVDSDPCIEAGGTEDVSSCDAVSPDFAFLRVFARDVVFLLPAIFPRLQNLFSTRIAHAACYWELLFVHTGALFSVPTQQGM